jgi:hypothetical protein
MSAPIELVWWAISPAMDLVILGVLALAIITVFIVFGGGWR